MNDYYDLVNAINGLIAVVGISFVMLLVLLLCSLWLIIIIARCKLFVKCGYAWWKAIIPIYRKYIFIVKICGLHWAWFIASVISLFIAVEANVVALIRLFVNAMSFYNLAIRSEKDKTEAMIFGAIVPGIMTMIYGFSRLEYNDDIDVKESGVF